VHGSWFEHRDDLPVDGSLARVIYQRIGEIADDARLALLDSIGEWVTDTGYLSHTVKDGVFFVQIPAGGSIPRHGDACWTRKNTVLGGGGFVTVYDEENNPETTQFEIGAVYRFNCAYLHEVFATETLTILVEP
jgi:hypothetical protein